ESLDRLLPEAFGAVCVAAQRTTKLRPFDVQLAGGVVLHRGALAELATGEGKTLVATMPTFLNALAGKGVHVTTVNDYLARRDAEWTGPIYRALGLTVGVLQMQMPEQARFQAYRSDITYGTASEFGFDFLRDRLKFSGDKGQSAPFWSPWVGGSTAALQHNQKVQREHHFALVDEADNIFIDEARTPLIISGMTRSATEEESVVYVWSDRLAKDMVRDRHWRDGLHQAVEAKERVQITYAADHAAQITFQSYFRLYTKRAGMTGTAAQNWLELRRVYKLWVVCVPTNRPVIREQWADRVFPTEDAKFDAVVEEVVRLRSLGRPVLI